MKTLTEHDLWQGLRAHQQALAAFTLPQLFAQDAQRFSQFSLKMGGLLLDYSKNRITQQTLTLLLNISKQFKLNQSIKNLFSGQIVNQSEARAATHIALRAQAAQHRMHFAQSWQTGYQTILHVGMGGSVLGPKLVYEALRSLDAKQPTCHFVTSFDDLALTQTLQQANPQQTLAIIVSKSFTTAETLYHAKRLQEWGCTLLAVTAHPERAEAFGITKDHIFQMDESVGGRYSVWSAVGLSVAMSLGRPVFDELLEGAREMDQHFQSAPFSHNLPVLLALLGLWETQCYRTTTRAVIPYSQRLRLLPAYLQQLHMESLGKSVTQAGLPLSHDSGPIVWGGVGTDSQHSFHQALMQGTRVVPVDFILPKRVPGTEEEQQRLLAANCLAQSRLLMCGDAHPPQPYQRIPGNRPSNTLLLDELSPRHLGALLAAYEHKVFVQSVLLGVNAFDQWGVERGKVIAKNLVSALQTGDLPEALDSSTAGLLSFLMK